VLALSPPVVWSSLQNAGYFAIGEGHVGRTGPINRDRSPGVVHDLDLKIRCPMCLRQER